jgi:hypothetical protein
VKVNTIRMRVHAHQPGYRYTVFTSGLSEKI